MNTLMYCYDNSCPGAVYTVTSLADEILLTIGGGLLPSLQTSDITGLTMTIVAASKVDNIDSTYSKTIEVRFPTGSASTTF